MRDEFHKQLDNFKCITVELKKAIEANHEMIICNRKSINNGQDRSDLQFEYLKEKIKDVKSATAGLFFLLLVLIFVQVLILIL